MELLLFVFLVPALVLITSIKSKSLAVRCFKAIAWFLVIMVGGASLIGIIANGDASQRIAALIFAACAFVLYFLPTIIAAKRRHQNDAAIFIINAFLGWTVLGWVIALTWSFTEVRVVKA
jgi:RsiW-degrading membrane proteinase PrsW (M82 family)